MPTIPREPWKDELWTRNDIVRYTGFAKSTIGDHIQRRDYPKPARQMKVKRWWYPEDIRQWYRTWRPNAPDTPRNSGPVDLEDTDEL